MHVCVGCGGDLKREGVLPKSVFSVYADTLFALVGRWCPAGR